MAGKAGLPETLLDNVRDEAGFLMFVRALAADFAEDRRLLELDPDRYRYAAGPLGWENGTIDDFLYAAEAGSEAGHPTNAANPWRRCAEILLAGKYYE